MLKFIKDFFNPVLGCTNFQSARRTSPPPLYRVRRWPAKIPSFSHSTIFYLVTNLYVKKNRDQFNTPYDEASRSHHYFVNPDVPGTGRTKSWVFAPPLFRRAVRTAQRQHGSGFCAPKQNSNDLSYYGRITFVLQQQLMRHGTVAGKFKGGKHVLREHSMGEGVRHSVTMRYMGGSELALRNSHILFIILRAKIKLEFSTCFGGFRLLRTIKS